MVEKLIVDEDANATSSQQDFFKIDNKKVIVESDVMNSGTGINNLQQSFMKILDKKVTLPGDGDGTRTLSSSGSNNYFYLAKDQQPTHYTPENDIVVSTPEEDSIVTHPTLSDDLVSYYKLDETSGTTVADSTGTNNATNYNATVNQTSKIDKAYDFNGSNAYLQSASQSFTGNANYTITAWIKTDVANTYQVILSNGIESTKAGLKFKINPNNTIGADLANVPGPSSTSTISTGTWYFVTLTKSSDTYQIYINGFANGSSVTITSSNISVAGTQRISKDVSSGTGYFNGLIDEIGIWTRALTSSEISDLYNSGDGLKYD